MNGIKRITAPLTKKQASELKCGEAVLLSGVIYTARDAAHKRLCELIENGMELPFDLKNSVIYYAGPAPAAPGRIIGSCGPTTSGRMDKFAPILLDLGEMGMIGKGVRTGVVKDAIKRNGAVYFGAAGGVGALMSGCVKKCSVIAFEDLGTEAIRRLEVEDMPLTVLIDSKGNDLYLQR